MTLLNLQKTFLLAILTFAVCSVWSQTSVPQTAEEYFRQGEALLRSNDLRAALQAFRTSTERDPKQFSAFANMGMIYARLGEFPQAISNLETAITIAPERATLHSALCSVFLASKQSKKAVAECRKATDLDPDSDSARALLIDAMRMAGLPDVDLTAFVEASIARLRMSEILLDAAGTYFFEKGEFAKAAEIFERLISIRPDSARAHGLLAWAYLRVGRDDDAIAEARRSLSIDPSEPVANYCMGELFSELGMHLEALNAFQKVEASVRKKLFPDIYLRIAIVQSDLTQYDASLISIKKAAAAQPNSLSALRQFADILLHLDRYTEAIPVFEKILLLVPKDKAALAGLGLSLFESFEFDRAIEVLSNADRIYPGDEVISMYLRVARVRRDGIPGIPLQLAELEKDPANIADRVSMITLLAYVGRTQDADKLLNGVLLNGSLDAKDLTRIAVAFGEAGQKDKSLDLLKKAAALKEEYAGVYFNLASSYADRGMLTDAIAAYTRGIELAPNAAGIMYRFAGYLRQNGRRREALDMLKRSLSIKPINPPALLDAGVLSAQLGDFDGAKGFLVQLNSIDPASASVLAKILRLNIWR